MKCSLSLLALCACATLASSAAWAGPSRADIVEARKLVYQGQKAEKANSWQDARTAYDQSIQRNDTPLARIRLAHVEEHLGHLLEAVEQYRVVAGLKTATYVQKYQAKTAIKRIEARIPRLTVEVPPGFSGSVRIDDNDLPASSYGTAIEVNPGTRIVTARAAGFRPFERSVVMAEASQQTLSLELEAMPARAPAAAHHVEADSSSSSGRKTWGYLTVVVGGAGVVVGTAFGLAARSTRHELDGECLNNICSESQRSTYDRGKMQADVSTVGFVVGAVGLGVGSYLLLTGPSEPEKQSRAHVAPLVGLGRVGLEGRF